jgi:hypothetical protein
MDFCLDPMYGKGNQAYASIGIETLYSLHQADVTFLYQVGLWQSIARVPTRDAHYQAQMGKNQLLSGI